MEILTIIQIAELFGVKKITAERRRDRHKGFPPSVGVAASGGRPRHTYDRAAVEQWGVLTGRWPGPVKLGPGHDCPCCVGKKRKKFRR